MTKRKGFAGFDTRAMLERTLADEGLPPPDYTQSGTAQPETPNLKPRISDGFGWLVAAVGFLCLGVFTGLAAAGGAYDAGAFTGIFLTLMAVCATLRLVLLIAHKIELRLIDIQKGLTAEK